MWGRYFFLLVMPLLLTLVPAASIIMAICVTGAVIVWCLSDIREEIRGLRKKED